MCAGALLQAHVDTVVFALGDPREGACASAVRLADAPGLPHRLRVVSGILQDAAADLRPDLAVRAVSALSRRRGRRVRVGTRPRERLC